MVGWYRGGARKGAAWGRGGRLEMREGRLDGVGGRGCEGYVRPISTFPGIRGPGREGDDNYLTYAPFPPRPGPGVGRRPPPLGAPGGVRKRKTGDWMTMSGRG